MPHPEFEALTDSRLADLQAAIAQGKHVTFAGRTATNMDELGFIIEAAGNEDESAEAVSARAAVLGGPRVPVTKKDLHEALQNAELEFNHEGLIEAIKGAISTEAQPLRDLAEAILSTLDKDATIRDQAVRIAVLESENASLKAAGTSSLDVARVPVTVDAVASTSTPEASAEVSTPAAPAAASRRR
ncbi:MAG: hypothetical protein V4671_02290 [Armatimonadota bacterium]